MLSKNSVTQENPRPCEREERRREGGRALARKGRVARDVIYERARSTLVAWVDLVSGTEGVKCDGGEL